VSEYLTVQEAAELARTPVPTIREWIRQQRFPSYRPGKRRLIKRADLIAFIESTP
jgi:excisionase family DNA binding protein